MSATVKDVAALAGVSPITASRALAGSPLVTEPTRRRVLEASRRSGYRPHAGARALRTGGQGLEVAIGQHQRELVASRRQEESIFDLVANPVSGAPEANNGTRTTSNGSRAACWASSATSLTQSINTGRPRLTSIVGPGWERS